MTPFSPMRISAADWDKINPHWNWHSAPHFVTHFTEGLHKPFSPNGNTSRQHPSSGPAFDIRETETHYFLDGEFPGTRTKGDLKIEWTGKRTLVIEADVQRLDLEQEWGITLPKATKPPSPVIGPVVEQQHEDSDDDDEEEDTSLHRCRTRDEKQDPSLPPNEKLSRRKSSQTHTTQTTHSTTRTTHDKHDKHDDEATRSGSGSSQGSQPCPHPNAQNGTSKQRRPSLSADLKRRFSFTPKARRASQAPSSPPEAAEAPPLRMWASERHCGEVKRTFSFPEDVDHDSLKARLNQGLLKIMVVKIEPMKPRLVTIETNGSYFSDH